MAGENVNFRALDMMVLFYRLGESGITADSCEIVASALRSENSPLINLELQNNNIGDEGLSLLSTGLTSSHCNLAKLRLVTSERPVSELEYTVRTGD